MSEAIQAGDYDQGSGDLFIGGGRARVAASFRKNTSIGSEQSDLDRFGGYAAAWKSKYIVPMEYLLNVMSMIPKKAKGEFRMIAAMSSGWRVDTILDQPGEWAWDSEVDDDNDSLPPRHGRQANLP